MKLRVTIDGQSFEVEVGDLNARPILATVDGETFEVYPEQEETVAAAPARPAAAAPLPVATAAPAHSAAPSNGSAQKGNSQLAPIPGVIIAIHVKEGDAVTVGQELLVLEAMKMKNSIRANRAGKVSALRVAQGDQVRKDQVLIEYTD